MVFPEVLPMISGPALTQLNAPPAPHNSLLRKPHVRALVVSSQLEVRQFLVRTLEAIPADVIVCPNRILAEEVLSRQRFEIVFCDEHLPDGSYLDLLGSNHWVQKAPRVVVTTRTGGWDLYFEAISKGAFDVIRTPACPTDIEIAVIRAVREDDRTIARRSKFTPRREF